MKRKIVEFLKLESTKSIVITVSSVVGFAILLGTVLRGSNEYHYSKAIEYYNNGEYEKAINEFNDCGRFRDAEEKCEEIRTEIVINEYIKEIENLYDSEYLDELKNHVNNIIKIFKENKNR